MTFCNYPGEKPVIDATGVAPPPDGSDTALFLLESRSFEIIRGFELRNYRTTNVALTPAGIFLDGPCQNIQILNCDIHDICNTGGNPAHSGNAFGMAVYGSSETPSTNIVIDGNDIHHLKTGESESLSINGNVTNFQVTHNTVHDNNNIGIVFIGFEGTVSDVTQDQARDGVCRSNTVWNITSQGNQAYAAGDFGADRNYGSATNEENPAIRTRSLSITAPVTGLNANATYHYRIVAASTSGTSSGADETFTTAAAPVVTTGAAGRPSPNEAKEP